jgi:hypothetical protein
MGLDVVPESVMEFGNQSTTPAKIILITEMLRHRWSANGAGRNLKHRIQNVGNFALVTVEVNGNPKIERAKIIPAGRVVN